MKKGKGFDLFNVARSSSNMIYLVLIHKEREEQFKLRHKKKGVLTYSGH